MHRVEEQVDENLLSNGRGVDEEIVRRVIFDLDADAALQRFLRDTEARVPRDGERAPRDVRRFDVRADGATGNVLSETRVRQRDVDRVTRCTGSDVALRSVEPPEDYGERVRNFVERAGKIIPDLVLNGGLPRHDSFHEGHTITAKPDGLAPDTRFVSGVSRRSASVVAGAVSASHRG